MLKSASTFKTEKGERYLNQLIKHFAHKIEAQSTGQEGFAQFGYGAASMKSDADGLHVAVEAGSEEELARTKFVIESHLIRFAFREELEKLEWQDYQINA